MARVFSINLLQTALLQTLQQRYHPTAKRIRVYYGVQWLLLLETPPHPYITTCWIPANNSHALEDLTISLTDPGNLLFIDPTIPSFSKICETFKICNCTEVQGATERAVYDLCLTENK